MKNGGKMEHRPINNEAQMKVEAIERANKIVEDIINAYSDPAKSVHGESLKFYQELRDWGWFDTYPVSENRPIYIKTLAMILYKDIKWQKEHSQDISKSKWEYVMGKTNRKR